MWVHSVLLCSSSYGLKHFKGGKHQVLPRTSFFVYHLDCSLLILYILWQMSGDSVISCKSKFQTLYLSVSYTLCYHGHLNKVLLNLWTPSTKFHYLILIILYLHYLSILMYVYVHCCTQKLQNTPVFIISTHKNKVILILNLLHSMCPITITKNPHTHTKQRQ